VRAETRHQLKQDRFSRATIDAAERTVHWTVEHQKKLIIAGIIVLVVAGAGLGSWYYLDQQDQKASVELTQAVRTFSEPIRPAGMPPQPDEPSFASIKERAEAARKPFQEIVEKYPHTHTAEFARYFLGLTSVDLGDNAAAERDLKEVASVRNKDLAALGKLALASVYRNTNRDKDALELYRQLADKPANTVGKVTAQMLMAETYQEMQQPDQAKLVYQQIQKDNPNSEAAQLATSKLQALKP
jgi:predicted negative regulator of RcsB-dependent stress response